MTVQHTRSVSQAEVIPPHSFKEDMIVIPVSDAEWNAVAYALLNRLFIHEWEDESYCDPTICDGEQWELNLRILTMPPVSALAKIHDRMPLMLPKAKTGAWIDPTANPADLLPLAINDVIIWK